MTAVASHNDAEFADAALSEPMTRAEPPAPTVATLAMEARRMQRPRLPWQQRIGSVPKVAHSSHGPLTAFLALGLVFAAGMGLRKSIVAAVPETAQVFAAMGLPVNLRGLEFRAIRSGVFNENSAETLVVQGEIANITGKVQQVPPLKFTVRNAKGIDVYSWVAAADVRSLEPGGKAVFRRRLASPPAEGSEVLVRFAGAPEQLASAH